MTELEHQTRRPARREALAMGLALVPLAFPCLSYANAAIGSVTEASGAGSVEGPPGTRRLDRATQLFLQDLVQTGSAGHAGLQLGSRTRVRLGENVRFRIDQYIVDRGGELMLGSGAAFIDTRGGQSAGLTVRSPSALIAVRGTAFFAGTERDGGFGVFVRTGVVDVTAGGRQVRLKTGEGTTIPSPGAPPGEVRRWSQERIDRAMALTR
jgi:ferric-dicitrate binding protein FerR (iron transport regulator)